MLAACSMGQHFKEDFWYSAAQYFSLVLNFFLIVLYSSRDNMISLYCFVSSSTVLPVKVGGWLSHQDGCDCCCFTKSVCEGKIEHLSAFRLGLHISFVRILRGVLPRDLIVCLFSHLRLLFSNDASLIKSSNTKLTLEYKLRVASLCICR